MMRALLWILGAVLLGGIEQFVLVWRLYDTPIGVATRTAKSGPMPAIARKGCS